MASLFAQFQIGSDWYAVPARRIARILPLAGIKPIPGAPAGIAGVLIHGATPVPVVDLSWLLLARPAARHFSTRIMLVTPFEEEQDGRLVGVIAEKMTSTIELEERAFVPTGVRADGAAYLGPIARLEDRLLQRVELGALLPRAAFDALSADVGMSQ